MLKKFSNGCVRIMNRWLPDPFLFAIILTIVVFIAACLGTQQSPWEMIWAWGGKGKGGDGMWGLLAFSMQMAWCWCWVPPWPPPRSAKRSSTPLPALPRAR